jgi:ElaB/YqjD/DUF883 family membrane-anchored ribosome-binding protein
MSNPARSGHATRPAASADEIGGAAFRDARASVEEAMADVSERGREALQGVREVRDTFASALLESVETRPYATLAVVAGIGFLAGAIWRR